jgi:hypothetical protein
MRLSRWVVASIAAAVLGLAVMVPVALAAEVDLHAHLSGSTAFPRATGFSSYERGDGGREVEVTVRNVGRLTGTRVTFFVAGQRIGTVVVSSAGTAHINREAEHGQFVPFASAGDRVSVKRTSNGHLVARGTYFRERED